MQYPNIIKNEDPLEVKNLQIMQCNSCIKVEGKFEEDCSTFPCTFKTETRIRCPVYKVKNIFTFLPTPKVCSCDNPSPGIGDVCTNGEPTPWYEPQDMQITKDEDGYCLGEEVSYQMPILYVIKRINVPLFRTAQIAQKVNIFK